MKISTALKEIALKVRLDLPQDKVEQARQACYD